MPGAAATTAAGPARHTGTVTETGDATPLSLPEDADAPTAPEDHLDEVSAPPSQAESVEDYYARIAAAAGPDGRLPVAVQEMPGWDIYPYEIDGLRLKAVAPPVAEEPARRGEDPAECWC